MYTLFSPSSCLCLDARAFFHIFAFTIEFRSKEIFSALLISPNETDILGMYFNLILNS